MDDKSYKLDTWEHIVEFKKYVRENNLSEPKFKLLMGNIVLHFGEEEFVIPGNKFKDAQKQDVIDFLCSISKEAFVQLKSKKFIFGKDFRERVVSCEVVDDNIELFIEEADGTIRSEFIPNEYWMLSARPVDESWTKLHGYLHYKYFKKFTDRQEYQNASYRFKNYDLYSIYDPKEGAMLLNGFTYFKGMKAKEVSVLTFDIETPGIDRNDNSKVFIIANTFRKNGVITRKMFSCDEFDSQAEMLTSWCDWVRDMNPSIMAGHNIFGFDLPYLQHVAELELVELNLGRDGSAIRFNTKDSKYRKDGSQFYEYKNCYIYGREIIDTMFLAMKYDIGRKYESYRLKAIIEAENLTVKDRQFYDAATIADNWDNLEERAKIKQYALHDGDDALALFDLMIPAYFYLNQSIPKSFQAVINGASGSWLNSFLVRSYLQEGHSVPKTTEANQFEGAISFGNPGSYLNVFKVDVASLYPSIMLQYKVFDKDKDPKQHFFHMVDYFTAQRLENKRLAKETGDLYYKDLEQAQKIVINSAYGMMGAPGLNFNSPVNAAFVTRTGREILQKSIDWATTNGFAMVNADTDSIAFCKHGGAEMTEDERKQYLVDINSLFPDKISWEDDGYYPAVLIIKAKNYVLFDGKKQKIKGSALKATTKEKALKEFINKTITHLLAQEHDKVKESYHEYVKEIHDLKDITRWASKKTVTEAVLNPERANEQKVADAIEDSDYQMGDKCYFYFDLEENLKLQEHWKGDHHVDRLLEKLFKTLKVFETVLDVKQFPNYKLKKNKKILPEVLGDATAIGA